MEPIRLRTERLELALATAATAQAAAGGDLGRLGSLLEGTVAADWPPEHVSDALPRVADDLERAPATQGFGMYFIVTRAPRLLIGTCGLYAPQQNGVVCLGYSIVPSQQRRGYATEAAQGLIGFAFSDPSVKRVIAETYPELRPSIRVLEKCGFTILASGVKGLYGDEGVVQYELARAGWRPTGRGSDTVV
jgi:RimJ/RimL family protein N-acetyltransferase